MTRTGLVASVAAVAVALPTAAQAQQAGDFVLRTGVARTKLVDKGDIKVGGVLEPEAGYRTRATYHGVVSGSFFPIDGVAIDASISTPATTNNIPAGNLAGTPNLGDDEFVLATIGGRVQPFAGPVSPYFGGGLQVQLTTQERDGLGVDLNIPNASGPYVEGGIEYRLSPRWGLYASVRKAWYHTDATGLLPLDASFTTFAAVDAKAVLDPLTIQAGILTRFGRSESGPEMQFPEDRSRWTIRAGLTALSLADRIDLTVGGAPYPGAGLSTFEHHTPTVQVGYFLAPKIAVNATLGLPPSIDVYGGGTIGALPKLGKVTYGPTALTLQYHPFRHGRLRPYVGVGLSYMIVFGTKDGAFKDLKVANDLAPAFEAGSDFMIGRNWGMFLDVKKALLRPKATGTFNGMTVEGKTRLDPWAFSGGLSFHF